MPKKSIASAVEAKAADLPTQKRVIVYWFIIPSMRDSPVEELLARIQEITSQANLRIVDLVLDPGPPKKHASEYPVLKCMERGEAEFLLVGRSSHLRRPPERDFLQARCRPEPMAFYTAEELRQLGLIPVPPKPRKSRTRRRASAQPRRPASSDASKSP